MQPTLFTHHKHSFIEPELYQGSIIYWISELWAFRNLIEIAGPRMVSCQEEARQSLIVAMMNIGNQTKNKIWFLSYTIQKLQYVSSCLVMVRDKANMFPILVFIQLHKHPAGKNGKSDCSYKSKHSPGVAQKHSKDKETCNGVTGKLKVITYSILRWCLIIHYFCARTNNRRRV